MGFFIDDSGDSILYVYKGEYGNIASNDFKSVVETIGSIINKDYRNTILFLIDEYKKWFMDKYFDVKYLFDLNSKFLYAERKLINYYGRDIKYIAEKALEMLGKLYNNEDVFTIDWTPQDAPVDDEEKGYWQLYLKAYYTLHNKDKYENVFNTEKNNVSSLTDEELTDYVINKINFSSLI